eukprot:4195412-Pyramimonas_sp.AAC.1
MVRRGALIASTPLPPRGAPLPSLAVAPRPPEQLASRRRTDDVNPSQAYSGSESSPRSPCSVPAGGKHFSQRFAPCCKQPAARVYLWKAKRQPHVVRHWSAGIPSPSTARRCQTPE